MSRYPCQKMSSSCPGGMSRRSFLSGIAAGTMAGGMIGCGPATSQSPHNIGAPFDTGARIQQPMSASSGSLAMPGPYVGRVIEVGHRGSISEGHRDAAVVKTMVEQGMTRLVPEAESVVDAWRSFFQPGDRVGIKVVPVGKVNKPGLQRRDDAPMVDLRRPGSISSYELVHAVVEGLESAGVKRSDMLVFDRYLVDFTQAGYVAMLPDGVHWECSSAFGEAAQLEIDGQVRGMRRHKNVSGYDRDVFREMPYCQPPHIHGPQDDRRFRSHLSMIVSQKVDKIVCLPVLKDHRTGGVTLALKNMSHGFVNNVARSHIGGTERQGVPPGNLNHCQTFIPAAVSLPTTREKCVLQILDGLEGTYEGGPGSWNSTFATWEYGSLFFATDPVALDRIGWEIIDAKRAEEGWPSVARMGLDSEQGMGPKSQDAPATEAFHIRQPQHIPLASLLGLGTFGKESIDHQRFQLA